jgi:eukaryotic-like serine/threonine-protein kinase
MAEPAPTPSPSKTASRAPDDLAARLWDRWQSGADPDLRQMLREAGPLNVDHLLAALRVDQVQRWQRGKAVPTETYLHWCPELAGDPERALELIYSEYLLREEMGPPPDKADYLRRFPQHADRLEEQLCLHAALAVRSALTPASLANLGTPGATTETRLEHVGPDENASLPTVAGYELLSELGRGGMGVVYKAWQERPRRLVALKMILAGAHAGAERRARLLAEADAIARLQHPHIVQIHEVGEHAGLPFLALEYMPGGSLDAKLGGQPQPPARAAELAETIARAVAHAHAAGVIHRDLKPANVLLAADGTPKITDFSLAKLEDAALTVTGTVLGTPPYMAPEQAAGSRTVGPAADVYAMGAILYEALTGRPPFLAATALETLEQVRFQEPVPVSQLQPRVPADLATVCLKCLEKDPARRYSTASDLAEDVRRFLDGRPVRARRASVPERMRRWVRRNPWQTAAGLLLVSLVVGVSAAAAEVTAAAWRLNREAQRAQRAERGATDQLYDALRARAEASRGSGLLGQRIESLRALRQAVTIADERGLAPDERVQLRNQAIACLALPDLSLEQEWDGSQPGTCGFDFDARFERYAWYAKDEGIHVCRREDHRELFRLPSPPAARVTRNVKCRFSPDGRYLAVYYSVWGERLPVEVWDLQGSLNRPIFTLPDATARPEFTPDSKTLVVCPPNGALTLFDLKSGGTRTLPPGWTAESLALHPDGKLVAIASPGSAGVQVRDLSSGAVTLELRHPAGVDAAAWSPDGSLLAVGCNDRLIHLWDSSTGNETGTLAGHHWAVHDLCFDATGRWLASFGWDMTLRIWDVGSRRQLLHVNEVRVTSFRQDGGLAVAGIVGRKVKVWNFEPSVVYDQLHGTTNLPHQVKFSPDGRSLIARGRDEEMCLWDVIGRRRLARWPELGMAVWGPEGSWLLAGGSRGFVRMPVRSVPGNHETPAGIRIGPGRLLTGVNEDARAWGLDWLTLSARRLLAHRFPVPFLRVIDVDEGSAREAWKAAHHNCNFVASSRDGRLAAAGTFSGGDGVRVWEASTGRLVQELPIGDARPAFSVRGDRLFTTTGRLSPRGAECRTWRLDTFEPDSALVLDQSSSSPSPMSIGSDGMVAVCFTIDDVRLLEPDSLQQVATLSAPDPRLVAITDFSPDASVLAVSTAGMIDLWDLRRLRAELSQLGLDWDRPPYPTPAATGGPMVVEVDRSDS